MTEQTIEQLNAELEMLKKQNLEKAIAEEKAKLAEKAKLEELEKEKKLRESLKIELEKELLGKQESRIVEEKETVTLQKDTKGFEAFKENFVKRRNKEGLGMTGKPYEEALKEKFGGDY
jgi:hypothetical protein